MPNFTIKPWSGQDNHHCNTCKFDTLSLEKMAEHQSKVHPIQVWPKVSCIMPTYNRRKFIPFALQQFFRYDYPNKELVIVDDGTEDILDLIPLNCPFVRYIHLEEKQTMGWKRNKACEIATGEIIAHHDDDDWYHPNRLREMVELLIYTGKEFTGIRDTYFYLQKEAQAYQYQYGMKTAFRATGATFVYTRNLWEAHKFSDYKDMGEDTLFNRCLPQESSLTLPESDLFVSIVHGENMSCGTRPDHEGNEQPIRNFQNKESWRPIPTQKVLAKTGDDAWYIQMQSGKKPICKILIAAVAGEDMYQSVLWIGEAMGELEDLKKCGIEAEVALAIDGSKETLALATEAITHCPHKIHLIANKEKKGLYFCKNQLAELCLKAKADYLLWWDVGVKPSKYLPLKLILKMRSGGSNIGVMAPVEGALGGSDPMGKPDWINFSLWTSAVYSEGVAYDELFSLEGLDGSTEEWDLLLQLTVKGFVLQYYEGMQLLQGAVKDINSPEADLQQLQKKREYLQSKWSRQ